MVDLSKQQLSSVGPMADVENFYPILVIRKASLFAGGKKNYFPTGHCRATPAGPRPGGSSSFIEEW